MEGLYVTECSQRPNEAKGEVYMYLVVGLVSLEVSEGMKLYV